MIALAVLSSIHTHSHHRYGVSGSGVTFNMSTGGTQLHLVSLAPYTLYAITVSASTQPGEGPASSPVTAMTLEDIPVSIAPTPLSFPPP